MCEYCHQYYCEPSCPNYNEDSYVPKGLIGICFKCGKHIFRREAFHFCAKGFLCGKCTADARLKPRYS